MANKNKTKRIINIDFVLPVYNSQTTIAGCINSLLNLQGINKDDRFYIIDDASTDNTARILKHFEEKLKDNPQFEFFYSQKRQGSAKLRNAFNSICKNKIIAVCDADYYDTRRGKAIKEFFAKYWNKYDVFYSAVNIMAGDDPVDEFTQFAYKWDFKSKCPISHPTVAYKRQVAEQCPYHEDSMETDLFEFMLLDMHKAGARFGGCNDPLMIKIENTARNRKIADPLKREKYKEYGIRI